MQHFGSSNYRLFNCPTLNVPKIAFVHDFTYVIKYVLSSVEKGGIAVGFAAHWFISNYIDHENWLNLENHGSNSICLLKQNNCFTQVSE